jgi:hypothetical protein
MASSSEKRLANCARILGLSFTESLMRWGQPARHNILITGCEAHAYLVANGHRRRRQANGKARFP